MKKRTYYDSTHTLKSVYEFLIKGHLKLYMFQTVTLHDPFTLESLLIIKYLKSQVAKIFLPVI